MTLFNAFARQYEDRLQFLSDSKTAIGRTRLWLDYFGDEIYVDEIGNNQIAAFVSKLRNSLTRFKRPYTNATINRALMAFSSLYNDCKKWGVKVADVNLSSFKLQEREAMTNFLTEEQYYKLLEVSPPHLKQQIIFLVNTGVRYQNMMQLDWSQVDMNSLTIAFKVKSSRPDKKQHIIPINKAVGALLLQIGVKDAGKVFGNINNSRKALKTALQKAGIAKQQGQSFHMFRHTAASWMLAKGVNIAVVKEVLGHSDIKTTMKYAHVVDSQKRDALDKLDDKLLTNTAKPEGE